MSSLWFCLNKKIHFYTIILVMITYTSFNFTNSASRFVTDICHSYVLIIYYHWMIPFQLVQQPETAVLGIILLHTSSEELASPREDLSMARKEELQRLLLGQVPTILSLLNSMQSYSRMNNSTFISNILWSIKILVWILSVEHHTSHLA